MRLNKALLLTLRLLGLFGLFGFAFGLTFGICLRLSLIVRAALGWAGLLLLGGATGLIGAIFALGFTVAALVEGSALFVALELVFVAN